MKEEIIEIDEEGKVHDFRETTKLRAALLAIREIASKLEDSDDISASCHGTDIIDVIDGILSQVIP